jgi:5-methylcytosine-specific restriction endonuclease McrA
VPRCPGRAAKHGYCEQHGETRVNIRRANRKIYNSPRWRAFRARFLEQYPFCGDRQGPATADSKCKAAGLKTPARIVDHVERITGEHDPRFVDPRACQSLCSRCHDSKSAKESHHAPLEPMDREEPTSWG